MRTIRGAAAFVMLFGASNFPLGAHATIVSWKVLNNNRVFLNEDNQKKFQQELCRARECSKENEDSDHLCQPYRDVLKGQYCAKDRLRKNDGVSYWIPLPESLPTAWDEYTATYGPKADYIFSKIRKIRGRAHDLPDNASCRWELIPPGPNAPENTNCAEFIGKVELDVPYKLTIHVTKPDNTIEDTSRDVLVHDIFVVALGDSYSSGEGNPHTVRGILDQGPYKSMQLDTWWDRRCHRSLFNFTSMAVGLAAIQNTLLDSPKHTFTYLNYACSGAQVKDPSPATQGEGGLLTTYAGRETLDQISYYEKLFSTDLGLGKRNAASDSKFLPAQIDQLKAMICPEGAFKKDCENMRRPDYVIMTIGGNDVGFGDIIRQALLMCNSTLSNLGHALGVSEQCAIDAVKGRLDRLARDLGSLATVLEDVKPKKVLLSEYVDLTHNEKRVSCDDFNMDRTLGPADLRIVGVGITREAAEITYRTVLLELNKVLKAAAVAHRDQGWKFVSGIERRSEIRGWCAKPSWFVTWADSSFKQGFLPDSNSQLSRTLTTGIAHPNIFAQNFAAWRIRCEFDKDGLIPAGFSQLPVDSKASCEPLQQ